jgi:hypothetical protein
MKSILLFLLVSLSILSASSTASAQSLPTNPDLNWKLKTTRAISGGTGGVAKYGSPLSLGTVASILCKGSCLVEAVSTLQFVAPNSTSVAFGVCQLYDGRTSPLCGADTPLPYGYGAGYPTRTYTEVYVLTPGAHTLQTQLRLDSNTGEDISVLRWRSTFKVYESSGG